MPMFRRKPDPPLVPDPSRYDKLPDEVLFSLLEASIGEAAHMLVDKELDPRWRYSGVSIQLATALAMSKSLERKVALPNNMV